MYMSRLDHSRLIPLLVDALSTRANPVLDMLDEMLAEATLMPPDEIPADLVTMNSEVVVEGPSGSVPRRLRLVYTAQVRAGNPSHQDDHHPHGSPATSTDVAQEADTPQPLGPERRTNPLAPTR